MRRTVLIVSLMLIACEGPPKRLPPAPTPLPERPGQDDPEVGTTAEPAADAPAADAPARPPPSETMTPPTADNDFNVVTSPSTVTLSQGNVGSVTVAVERAQGCTDEIGVEAIATPGGIRASRCTIDSRAWSCVIQLETIPDKLAAGGELLLRATGKEGRTKFAKVDITVAAAPHDTGALHVEITAPPGPIPQVEINGPDGFHVVLSDSRTLTPLPTGQYAVVARNVRVSNGIVSTYYQAQPTECCVTVKADALSALTVSYKIVPGTGYLWLSSLDYNVLAYSGSQLSAGGTGIPPAIGLGAQSSADSLSANSVYVDRSFNLWVATPTQRLFRFPRSEIASSGFPTASLEITGLNNPYDVTADSHGNLWVLDILPDRLLEFGPESLIGPTVAATAALRTIVLPSGTVAATATGIAFDADDNLYVCRQTVVEVYHAATLAAVTSVPDASLYAGVGLLWLDVGFDRSNNLWIAEGTLNLNGSVMRFDAPGLRGLTGNYFLSPDLTLMAQPPVWSSPSTLAFDDSGNLWLGSFTKPYLVALPAHVTASRGVALVPPLIALTPDTARNVDHLAFDP